MSKKSKTSEAASLAALLAGDPAVEAKVEREIQFSTVVSHLLSLRVGKGLTQDQVAEAVGCDASKISRLEAGTDDNLKWMDMVRYADAVGVDIRLAFENRDMPAADRIKHCVFEIDHGLKQLAELAKIHSFYAEVLFNFLARYKDNCDSIGLTIRAPQAAPKAATRAIASAASKSEKGDLQPV
jgi:transcriptional regulator with XRE-family HTH domain